MEVLAKIYWLRVAIGAIAGLICTAAVFLFQSFSPGSTLISVLGSFNTLLNGITISLFMYIVSYYILKSKFSSRIEKKSKIMTMGIFIYFFTWLIVWVLTLSLIIGPA